MQGRVSCSVHMQQGSQLHTAAHTLMYSVSRKHCAGSTVPGGPFLLRRVKGLGAPACVPSVGRAVHPLQYQLHGWECDSDRDKSTAQILISGCGLTYIWLVGHTTCRCLAHQSNNKHGTGQDGWKAAVEE